VDKQAERGGFRHIDNALTKLDSSKLTLSLILGLRILFTELGVRQFRLQADRFKSAGLEVVQIADKSVLKHLNAHNVKNGLQRSRCGGLGTIL